MAFRVLNQRRHQGVDFVEVVQLSDDSTQPTTAGGLHYAVPGTFAPGDVLDITVTKRTAEPGLGVAESPVVRTEDEAPSELLKVEPEEPKEPKTKKK